MVIWRHEILHDFHPGDVIADAEVRAGAELPELGGRRRRALAHPSLRVEAVRLRIRRRVAPEMKDRNQHVSADGDAPARELERRAHPPHVERHRRIHAQRLPEQRFCVRKRFELRGRARDIPGRQSLLAERAPDVIARRADGRRPRHRRRRRLVACEENQPQIVDELIVLERLPLRVARAGEHVEEAGRRRLRARVGEQRADPRVEPAPRALADPARGPREIRHVEDEIHRALVVVAPLGQLRARNTHHPEHQRQDHLARLAEEPERSTRRPGREPRRDHPGERGAELEARYPARGEGRVEGAANARVRRAVRPDE